MHDTKTFMDNNGVSYFYSPHSMDYGKVGFQASITLRHDIDYLSRISTRLISLRDVSTSKSLHLKRITNTMNDKKKLYLLANFFDLEDNSGRWSNSGTEVQEDLRRIANNLQRWVSVKDALPLEEFSKGVCSEFLVTVAYNDPDPNDDPETMLLWFDNTSKQFSYDPGGESYDETNDWHVTHWMNKPKPARG